MTIQEQPPAAVRRTQPWLLQVLRTTQISPLMRVYTLRRHDVAANEIEIDFVLHGDNGPVSAWASRAKPGDYVGVGAVAEPEPAVFEAEWCLFVGDISALPAISAYLEHLPASTRGQAFVEIPDAAEAQQLDYRAQITLTWLPQNGVQPGRSTLLENAVRALEWPASGSSFAWIAGKSSAVVAVRDFLRAERGRDRENMYAVPYWKAGLDEDQYHNERHRIMDEEED